MEEKIINQIQSSLPSLFFFMEKQKKRNIIINYDKEVDVLYISFEALQKANDTEFFSDDILVRKKNKAIIGLTLLNFKKSLSS
ncbi:conserved hypothetical protein [Candidatus Roizmanbacteria bacterium]|nr:conserved hypothetical protein [Candidatus Roizmanbacteria bacterium]